MASIFVQIRYFKVQTRDFYFFNKFNISMIFFLCYRTKIVWDNESESRVHVAGRNPDKCIYIYLNCHSNIQDNCFVHRVPKEAS